MKEPINVSEYTYHLPQERIALFPLARRDESKLLVYRSGSIRHCSFQELPLELPQKTLLVFNNTKVIQARLLFEKKSGAVIEVFLLHPVAPSVLLLEAMQSTTSCDWQCTIGNLKRWKPGDVLTLQQDGNLLEAELLDRNQGLVRFRWNNNITFAEIISHAGQMPLPPYLKRKPGPEDKERYQTIYSLNEGAVAAPTAGLHFTDTIFDALDRKGISRDFVTLHVSAGTFQPIKAENAADHVMHQEQIVISKQSIHGLIAHDGPVIPVGTTSMRTMESLYWYGVKLMTQPDCSFNLSQTDAYELPQGVSRKEALQRVIHLLDRQGTDILVGETSIFITPGYTFRMCTGLVTNFHQPASTLILLVAAFIGEDWRKVYQEALDNGYRFLSYGDSSLLLP
jgi:S-adenosylmethionine:tRNA ribosyltransferase-isomerase